ncbi:uncharacterized protein CPUR_01934 [Claviceps purpurea 20.1]|uniref:Uncharacterized protein n=1 Tax=Claviceps purpurea (strain 20.1) TaxID=1111077 RepID=M1WBV3_CLAP2|nr:uncharacterized protein CPUR_01934 [Claviceps purpurea 20.1]
MSFGMRPLSNSCLCPSCVKSRLKELPHLKPATPGTYPSEFIHTDIAGPTPDTWTWGSSLLGNITPLRQKSELSDALFSWLNLVEHPKRLCHRIRLDQAGEITTSSDVIASCRSSGIDPE